MQMMRLENNLPATSVNRNQAGFRLLTHNKLTIEKQTMYSNRLNTSCFMTTSIMREIPALSRDYSL